MDTRLHSFFYTIGVATTASIFYYFWNNHYPGSAERLIADAGWAYCGIEARFAYYARKLSHVMSPFTGMLSPAPVPNKEVTFYKGGSVVKEMGLLEFRQLDETWDVEYDYGVYSIENDAGKKMTRIFSVHTGIDLDDLKFSDASLLSAVLKQDGVDDVDLDVTTVDFRSSLLVGSELFTREFMQQVYNISLPDKYTIDVIDSNVTQQTVEAGGLIRVEADKLVVSNTTSSRDSSFEEVEPKKRRSFLFGWMGGDADPQSKKDD